MAKYAIFKLKKVSGKNQYIPEVHSIEKSMTAAIKELESYVEDCLSEPVYYDKSEGQFICYKVEWDIAYVPKYKQVDPFTVKCVPYRRATILYVDKYPCPFDYYKESIHGDSFKIIGVKE